MNQEQKKFWDILRTPPKTKRELLEEEVDRLLRLEINKELDKEILDRITKATLKTSI